MGTAVGVVLIQLLGTIVLMVWIPAAAFAAVPPAFEEAGRDAGAGPVRTFLGVILPMGAPGIFVAVVLVFLASFDEAQGALLVGVFQSGRSAEVISKKWCSIYWDRMVLRAQPLGRAASVRATQTIARP